VTPVSRPNSARALTHVSPDLPPLGAGIRAVVVGEAGHLAQVLQHPTMAAYDGRLSIAAVVPIPPADADGNPDDPSLIPEEVIRDAVRDNAVDALLLAGDPGRLVMTALGELAITMGCRLLLLAPASVPQLLAPMIVWERGVPVIEMAPPFPPSRAAVAKRLVDLVLAAVGLLVTAPLLVLLVVAIRLDSPGHPLFGHLRVGRGGRRFRCWKLRTMRVDAEAQLVTDATLRAAYEANDFKLPDAMDPRITRLGRWLRRTSLDELPQLWNVLRGEMALVGPRPLVADELVHYHGSMLQLLSVRPGITGAWAVSGRHHLCYPQRAEVELAYVRSHTLGADLRILLGTVAAVLDPGEEGAGRAEGALRNVESPQGEQAR
jgi:exopolysaccharide production protein ExoY